MSSRDDGPSLDKGATPNGEPAAVPDTVGAEQERNRSRAPQPLGEAEDTVENKIHAAEPLAHDDAWAWNDPFQDIHGVLLNDYIERYSQLMGLIKTTDDTSVRDHVEAAAYTLRVGSSIYTGGEERHLAPGEVIRIPSNGLVYVATKEELNLPYYLIAAEPPRKARLSRLTARYRTPG